MKEYLSFDDVLILPQFSTVKSRKDVETDSFGLRVPIVSSNMDTVTGPDMAKAMSDAGGVGCLHRFCSIEDNVKMYREALFASSELIDRDKNTTTYKWKKPWVSIGLGYAELDRAIALDSEDAKVFVIDVAHGASMEVVNQYKSLRNILGINKDIIVGNFSTARTIKDFLYHVEPEHRPLAFKVGIGGGSACLTRVVTGCGVPTLGSIIDCATADVPIIADGGIRNSGDFAKAIAAGASAVMMGRLFAGCEESPSQIDSIYIDNELVSVSKLSESLDQWLKYPNVRPAMKKYRGSASQESYAVQNKVSEWRTAEGDSYLIPYTGPVKNIMQQFEAGLRSAMSYTGSNTIDEFRENATFIRVTNGGAREGEAHGKTTNNT